jgi:hypothetical protein
MRKTNGSLGIEPARASCGKDTNLKMGVMDNGAS